MLGANDAELCSRQTLHQKSTRTPIWNETFAFPDAHEWTLDSTRIKFTLFDYNALFDYNITTTRRYIGETVLPLRELLERPHVKLLLQDTRKFDDPVREDLKPWWPCRLEIQVDEDKMPVHWPKPQPRKTVTYPKHIFIMTRGTRGDIQPFVALAKGMAEQKGWLVTLCTELTWKSWIKAKTSNLRQGKVNFVPSGGNTEQRVNTVIGKWALSHKSELMQMIMMAFSEATFFPSCTTILRNASEAHAEHPISSLIYGFTLCQISMIVSKALQVPMCGFMLQPTAIPSKERDWKPVQAISGDLFTDHATLQVVKSLAESFELPFKELGQRKESFWDYIERTGQPLLIPMNEDTFQRPVDWSASIRCSSFIFLREPSSSNNRSLEPALLRFVTKAKFEEAKLGVITVSSMPGCRNLILQCVQKMVENCRYDFRMIYVGQGPSESDWLAPDVEKAIASLKEADRFCEVPRADFGVLFPELDAFVIHGGLGTTVEALRIKKPVAITGPLALDQRWWGKVVHQKGIGPEPVHLDRFEQVCTDFANNALDPSDPCGWQANARKADWGDVLDDGVEQNVNLIETLINDSTKALKLALAASAQSRRDTIRISKAMRSQSVVVCPNTRGTPMAKGSPLARGSPRFFTRPHRRREIDFCI